MPVLTEFRFKSCNCKNDIYVRQWSPDGEPVGVVQLCHGIAEYIERYDDLAKFLAGNGYVVVGDDHLGHGRSIANPEEAGYVGESGGWDMMVGDMRRLYEHMRKQYEGLPYFILGHSMGSFLTRTFIIRYHDGPDGVILSGTGTQPAATLAIAKGIANMRIKSKGGAFRSKMLNDMAFAGYNKKVENSTSDFDWLTSDKAVVKAYEDDPLCGFVPTVGLYSSMFSGLQEIEKFSNVQRVNKTLPIYIYSGGADPVGNYGKGVRQAYDAYVRAGVIDVSLKLYDGARHECHNDFCKDEVYKDVLAWLEKKRANVSVKQPA